MSEPGLIEPPATSDTVRYRRILLKLSGEALLGTRQYGVDPEFCRTIAEQLARVKELGVEIGIVVGGGNIFRGLAASARGMDRATGDYIGMLATVMNGLALQDALERAGVPTRVMTAVEINAEVLLKATKVDGVYDKDPMAHADAQRYAHLDYADLLRDQLKVLDATAVSLCMENDLPIVVFDLNRPDNITRVAAGESVGTLISGASGAAGGAPA